MQTPSLSNAAGEGYIEQNSRERSRSPRRVQDAALPVSEERNPGTQELESAVSDGYPVATNSPQAQATPNAAADVSVPVYSNVKPNNWVAKQVGKTSMGSPTICIYDNVTRTAPLFCLYKGSECGTLVFPLEPRKDAERPAFMTGLESTKKVESLDLIITLEGEQLQFARDVDAWCKQQALANSKDWFGRTCTETEIDVMYSSPIRVDETGRYAPNLRAKMNLGGIDKYLTQVTFVRSNDTPEEGAGWEFVEPRLGEQKWRQHRARMVLEARRIWIVGRKFGLSYSITDLAVRELPQRRPTPFANDSTVEALSQMANS